LQTFVRIGWVLQKTFWFDLFEPFAVPIDVHLQNANVKFDKVV